MRDDEHTMIGMPIKRENVFFIKQVLIMLGAFLVFALFLGVIAFFQYRACQEKDEDITFTECVRSFKIKAKRGG